MIGTTVAYVTPAELAALPRVDMGLPSPDPVFDAKRFVGYRGVIRWRRRVGYAAGAEDDAPVVAEDWVIGDYLPPEEMGARIPVRWSRVSFGEPPAVVAGPQTTKIQGVPRLGPRAGPAAAAAPPAAPRDPMGACVCGAFAAAHPRLADGTRGGYPARNCPKFYERGT